MMELKSYFSGLTKQQTNEVAYLVVLGLREGLDPAKFDKLLAVPDHHSSVMALTIARAIEKDEGAKLSKLSVTARHRYIEELGKLSRDKTLDGVSQAIRDEAESELRTFRAM